MKLKVSLGDQWQGCEGKNWQENNATVEDNSLKLPNIPLHSLRHTSATLLISDNIDVRTVSARLGHAQTSTTMNIYAHSLKKSDEKAASSLNNLLIKKA
ncbi:hypothetical protein GCM10023142_20820 [Anaerocolumna aminovalerica]|uniref:Phage integrase family protein n=1 Tax=Anaerocolumna aminovalerica TaxID=1527 RepID=A0A1I5D712_9FIRM|nr:tyrosine-type recombinase/integrase [Anaerocolumna aminovalerica]SFN94621.1 Phage integrase family protein [Anaerocolumna aminovalerica]